MDLKDLEVPVSSSSSSWIPITPARASLPRRPPTTAGTGPAGQPMSSNSRMKSTSALGSNWSDGSFYPGSQWQNVGSHTSCPPTYTVYQHHFNNYNELGASGRQPQHLLPKPHMQVTSSSVRQWTQATVGDNVHHLHSPFQSVHPIGVSQQQAQAQQSLLLNGNVPLHPHVSSGNSRNEQLSHYGAFNPYLPEGYYLYRPEIAARMAGKDTVVTPAGSMTSDECRRVQGGHVMESSNLEDWGSSIEEHRQNKQHTVSNVKNSFEICFNQGPILPSTIMPGEFSLLLQNQHQKAENWHATSNRIAPASLAPLTPEKDTSIHRGLPAETIKLVDHGETEKYHQKMNDNLEIDKEHMPDYHFQGALGQTDLSPFECFLQHQENKENGNAKIQGTDVNKTPLQKSKRKKHRPKVIREGKPVRKPRWETPKSTGNTDLEKPSAKRKYVRKKKADMDTPSTKVGKTSEIGDISGQRSAKRSLNFDSEAVLYDESESSSMRSDCNVYSRDLDEGRSSYNGGSCIGSVPLPQGLEKVVDPTKFLFTPNSIKEASGKHTRLCNSSDQDPAQFWRECLRKNHNYIRENQRSSGHTLHRVTPETILTLDFPFAEDVSVNGGLQKECNLSSNATYQSLNNVVVGNNYQRDGSINNSSIYQYSGDQVNHLPEINKKRKASGELELTSNSKQLSFSGKEDVVACGKKLAEQVVVYVQTEGTRSDLSNSPAKICSQLVSTPTKDDNCKQMSSVGRVSEGKNITVTPHRRKHNATHANNIGSEQGCQRESEVFGSGTPCKKESQQTQSNALKSLQRQRNRKKENDPSSSIGAMAPPADPLDLIVQKTKSLYIGECHVENMNEDILLQSALVPYQGDGTMVPFEGPLGPSKKRFPRAKVDLDSETNRVWMLLMGKDANSDEALGKDKEKWWEEQRCVFRGRVDSFIARMHLVQGDRRFSQWKGSVVDSVIGVFLTQNVSDHLSSSAFMALAARYPVHSNDRSRESSTVIESSPSTNKAVKVVEIEGEDDLQDNISNPIPGQSLSNLGKTHYTKEKGTEYGEAAQRNTEDSVFDNSNERNIDKHGTENKQGITSLENRTFTALSSREQMNNAEMDDLKSTENGFSQNSVISSQNSAYSPVQTVDRVGINLETHPDIEAKLLGTGWNCLEDSTPFSTLLRLADTGTFHGFYLNRSGSTASKESLANANDALEYSGLGESQPMLNHMFKLNDGYTSNHTFKPNDGYTSDVGVKSHEASNFTMSSYVSSTSHLYSASDSGMAGGDVSGKGSPFFTSLMSEINNITCTRNSCSKGSLLDRSEISVQDESLSTSQSLCTVDPCQNTGKFPANKLTSSPKKVVNFDEKFNLSYVPRELSEPISNIKPSKGLTNVQAGKNEQSEREATYRSEQGTTTSTIQNSGCRSSELHSEPTHCNSSSDDAKSSNATGKGREASAGTKGWVSASDATKEAAKNKVKPMNRKAKKELKDNFDWDGLRKEVWKSGSGKERSSKTMDSVNWEAVRNADVNEISNVIRERGMNNMLAERIKDFLDRLVGEHGSIDLEWLRDIPPDKAKDYLLSIRGLGLKSVECVRLLTLHHLAFPVDTNVGRICVRLGWVPLQPLPESLQLHLLELYPMLENIQKYLWPRLCTLDQRTLYELHYQLITFGKVFCTKSKPNCNACPMRGECKHFASAFASARLALPGLEENGLLPLTNPSVSEMVHKPASYPISLPQLEDSPVSQSVVINNSEPIIEEPTTPEPECLDHLESAIENFYEDPDEIPTIKLNIEQFTQNLHDIFQGNNMELKDGDMSKALVTLTPEVASIPHPKLKNVSRLRTEHQVYELPDCHPLLAGLDQREVDDPCPYLLAIWTSGETSQSTESPDRTCTAQDKGKLCNRETCFSCNSVRETQAQTVRGTLLIPCRTAMRGSFPLNGTYFQVNEVFADHSSSLTPIVVPREWLWSLPRRTVYFGTSVTSIFRGLTTEGIQQCFWRGFVCVRGFDQKTRAPRPLLARLHFPASKAVKNKKKGSIEE